MQHCFNRPSASMRPSHHPTAVGPVPQASRAGIGQEMDAPSINHPSTIQPTVPYNPTSARSEALGRPKTRSCAPSAPLPLRTPGSRDSFGTASPQTGLQGPFPRRSPPRVLPMPPDGEMPSMGLYGPFAGLSALRRRCTPCLRPRAHTHKDRSPALRVGTAPRTGPRPPTASRVPAHAYRSVRAHARRGVPTAPARDLARTPTSAPAHPRDASRERDN